jgi:hypothetical protein
MAAITAVYTLAAVALMLDVSDLCIDMEPEDGCLTVYGPGQDDTPAFTRDGIDRLRELIAELSQFDLPLHPP